MIQFVKTFKVKFPVWVDGIKTDETEERIKILFKETLIVRGIPQVRHGSIAVMREWTEQDVLENYSVDEDLTGVLKLERVEGSDFCKVVLC